MKRLVVLSTSPDRSLAALSATAQDQPTVVAVSTFLDGRGNVVHDTRIVVEHGKITRIDPKASPIDVDLRGLTVMSGPARPPVIIPE